MAQFEAFSLPPHDSTEHVARATEFRNRILSRRTIRHFSDADAASRTNQQP